MDDDTTAGESRAVLNSLGHGGSQDMDNGEYEQLQLQQHLLHHQHHHHRRQSHHRDGVHHHHHVTMKATSSRSTLTSLDSADLLTGNGSSVSSRAAMCSCVGRSGGRGSGGGGSRRSRHRSRRRWPDVAVLGRTMFVVSVAFFVVGILVTVFGFGGGAGTETRDVVSSDGVGTAMTSTGQHDAHATRHILPMQIVGPALLVATLVVWLAGLVFWRLWSTEWKRRQRAMELRTRVQLHALAMDLMKHPTLGSSPRCSGLVANASTDLTGVSSLVEAGVHQRSGKRASSVTAHLSPREAAELQDPRLRRLLMRKLRQQNALDLASSAENSRRSSRAASLESRRRRSSTVSALLRQAASSSGGGGASSLHGRRDHRLSVDVTSGKSSRSSHRGRLPSTFAKLPGIEISRIDTMDFDDGSSVFSSTTGGLRLGSLVAGPGGRQRFIVIHSDGSSDISRLSFPSEYSLSATSRSRSSRASSNVSSRLWDFTSPRESDWDVADMAISSSVVTSGGVGSSSAAATSRPDLRSGRDYSLLTPSMPRKGSSVTFDIGEPTVRRHSSPAPSLRFRKDSIVDADCGSGSQCAACNAATAAISTGKKPSPKSTASQHQLHQPLEKRSSSRCRGGDPQQESLVSIAMATSGHDDVTVGSRVCKAGATNDSSSRTRSSISSLKPSLTCEKTSAPATKIEALYGSGGVSRNSGLYTPLKRNTSSEPYHHLHQRDGNIRATSDGKDRPSSAPLKAEAETQTPPSSMRSEAMQQYRKAVDSSCSNILSPPLMVSSCGDSSLFGEMSASDNEDNDSEDHGNNVVDELLAANLDTRRSAAGSAISAGNSLSGVNASPESVRAKVGGMTCKLSTSLFGRGRHQQQTHTTRTDGKSTTPEPDEKSATGGGSGKSARSSIFMLLGLAE